MGVTIDVGYYFFRKHKIIRRDRSQNRKIQFDRIKPSFKIKEKLSTREKELKVAGIMLYWAEGSKWSEESNIDFANSGPSMIKLFLSFLREICQIDESKLRVYLYCFSNQNIDELIKYWSNITRISEKQFTKPYIKKISDENKIGKMKNGLIHVRYYDKKLYTQMIEWITKYKIKY